MRKLMLSLATLFFMAGLVVAAEVTLVKYDKDTKTVTVKDGDKEVTGKIGDKTKVTVGDKEGTVADAEKSLTNEKAVGKKYDITIADGAVTEIKLKGKKK